MIVRILGEDQFSVDDSATADHVAPFLNREVQGVLVYFGVGTTVRLRIASDGTFFAVEPPLPRTVESMTGSINPIDQDFCP